MAKIEIVAHGSTSLTVRLAELGGGWTEADGDRMVSWLVDGMVKGTTNIFGTPSESDSCVLSGLQPSTTYYIQAVVYKYGTADVINILYLTVQTASAEIPTIQSFGVGPSYEYDDPLYIDWSATFKNVVSGSTTYDIYISKQGVDEYRVEYGTLYNNSAYGTIGLPDYGNWRIRIELGARESMAQWIEIKPTLNPKITELHANILMKSWIEICAKCSLSYNITYEFYYTTDKHNAWLLMDSNPNNDYVDDTTGFLEEGITYQFFVRVTYGGWYYEDSDILTYTARTFEKPSELTTSRGYKSLSFKWNDIAYVSYYSTFLTRDAENETYLICVDSSVTFSDETLKDVNASHYFTTMDFGTTYTFTVRPYYQKYTYYIGDCEVTEYSMTGTNSFGWDVTTLPAPPTLSLSSQDSKIYINYGILASSGVDSFVFELFSDSSYSNVSRCESITVANNNSSNLNPSGSTNFNGSYGAGTYYVRARTFYNSLGSITESGADYVYATVTLSSTKPDKWSWDTSNDRLNAYNAIRKVSDFTVKDFSYLVWNDFVDKVNEFLTYKKYDNATINEVKYGFPATTTYAQMLQYAKMNNTDVDGKFLTAKRFNIVRYCIGSMKATGLPEQSSGDTAYGHYFITLAEVLNSIT